MKGPPPDDFATIDHLVSRLKIERWVYRKSKSKVLSCYKCNQQRGIDEISSLSNTELKRRSNGFSFNPRGKPIITTCLNTLDEVVDRLKQNGILT